MPQVRTQIHIRLLVVAKGEERWERDGVGV